MKKIASYVNGQWFESDSQGRAVYNAVTGEQIGTVSSDGIDFKAVLDYGRKSTLREMTIHERALALKALAMHLNEKKKQFYPISAMTGATRSDGWVDIEGGIGTMFSMSSIARRELPNEPYIVEGDSIPLSKNGTFVARHILTPKNGVSLHINAFNFPCWGMLEKIAPSLIAGMPVIVKPGTVTCYLTEAMVREMIASEIFPEGSIQLICGGIGDLFDHLTSQDVVTFTGSASTAQKLKAHPNIVNNCIPFNTEADSLNCCILGETVKPDSEEFKLFVKEVVNEMTVKAGQKCTAIRRTIVPRDLLEPAIDAISKRLDGVVIGNPDNREVRMGALVGQSQRDDVRENVEKLKQTCQVVYGEKENFEVLDADAEKGAFYPPTLLYCGQPLATEDGPHAIEAFGPVNTIMPYDTLDDAIEIARRGKGSLAGSVFTHDNSEARKLILGCASYHGRMLVINRDCAAESTGHGSPLPMLVHGGPGRAGGGEELGGSLAIKHYMQRTAIQGSPSALMAITNEYTPGAITTTDVVHPFRKYFEELAIGECYQSHRRTVTEADIVNFGCLSGDHFYAHFDDIAAQQSPVFGKRVAHGYFLISAAAGLFVDPAPGPVLANYGLDNLRFITPVGIGDTIAVKLVVKQKIRKAPRDDEPPQGIVKWAVEMTNQEDELVALYDVLTLVLLQPDESGG